MFSFSRLLYVSILQSRIETCLGSPAQAQLLIYVISYFQIDLIKEIMCNHTINGRMIRATLSFIAAVNPYRKHSAVRYISCDLSYIEFI